MPNPTWIIYNMTTVTGLMEMLQYLQVDLGATNLEFEHHHPFNGVPYERVTGKIPVDNTAEVRRALQDFLYPDCHEEDCHCHEEGLMAVRKCEFYACEDLFLFELEWY